MNYWFRANRPEFVFLVAGTVGGILATYDWFLANHAEARGVTEGAV